MRIVFSVIFLMVKSFIGGTLAFEGSMLKLSGLLETQCILKRVSLENIEISRGKEESKALV